MGDRNHVARDDRGILVMPLRAPRIGHCGCVIPAGQRCACQVVRDRERKAMFDRSRPSARERGYDTRWDQERAAFLRANPSCRRCGAPATVVDHVTPHRGNMGVFWNRSNWQALCAPCHNRHKQALECRELRR